MAKAKIILLIGIILIIVGIIVSVAGFFGSIKDPSEEAEETCTLTSLGYGEASGTVDLKSGDYEIWFEDEGFFDLGPGEITIYDEDNNEVYSSESGEYSESISVNNTF